MIFIPTIYIMQLLFSVLCFLIIIFSDIITVAVVEVESVTNVTDLINHVYVCNEASIITKKEQDFNSF